MIWSAWRCATPFPAARTRDTSKRQISSQKRPLGVKSGSAVAPPGPGSLCLDHCFGFKSSVAGGLVASMISGGGGTTPGSTSGTELGAVTVEPGTAGGALGAGAADGVTGGVTTGGAGMAGMAGGAAGIVGKPQ